MKLQYNVQRFSLKHLQKVESNKSLSAKNDKEQQMQLRQAEKDYYELFEALSERDKMTHVVNASPFQPYLLSQTQAQFGSDAVAPGLVPDAEEGSVKLTASSAFPDQPQAPLTSLRPPRLQDEYKSSSDSDAGVIAGASNGGGGVGASGGTGRGKRVRLDDYIDRKGGTSRAIAELNASSTRQFPDLSSSGDSSPLVTRGDLQSPPATAPTAPTAADPTTTPAPVGINNLPSALKRTPRALAAATPAAGDGLAVGSARSTRLARRGLSAKFDEEGNVQSIVLKPMPNAVHTHDQNYRNWALRSLNNMSIHKAMGRSMARATEVVTDHDAFCRRFEQECRRTFEHVHTLGGILEVTPMQALHLPETKNPMLVRVSYGETVSVLK